MPGTTQRNKNRWLIPVFMLLMAVGLVVLVFFAAPQLYALIMSSLVSAIIGWALLAVVGAFVGYLLGLVLVRSLAVFSASITVLTSVPKPDSQKQKNQLRPEPKPKPEPEPEPEPEPAPQDQEQKLELKAVPADDLKSPQNQEIKELQAVVFNEEKSKELKQRFDALLESYHFVNRGPNAHSYDYQTRVKKNALESLKAFSEAELSHLNEQGLLTTFLQKAQQLKDPDIINALFHKMRGNPKIQARCLEAECGLDSPNFSNYKITVEKIIQSPDINLAVFLNYALKNKNKELAQKILSQLEAEDNSDSLFACLKILIDYLNEESGSYMKEVRTRSRPPEPLIPFAELHATKKSLFDKLFKQLEKALLNPDTPAHIKAQQLKAFIQKLSVTGYDLNSAENNNLLERIDLHGDQDCLEALSPSAPLNMCLALAVKYQSVSLVEQYIGREANPDSISLNHRSAREYLPRGALTTKQKQISKLLQPTIEELTLAFDKEFFDQRTTEEPEAEAKARPAKEMKEIKAFFEKLPPHIRKYPLHFSKVLYKSPRNPESRPCLMIIAIAQNNIEVVRYFLSSYKETDYHFNYVIDTKPIKEHCFEGVKSVEMAKLLLAQSGARDTKAIQKRLIFAAEEEAYESELTQYLITQGTVDIEVLTAAATRVNGDDLLNFDKWLAQAPKAFDINTKNSKGWTLLETAASWGQPALVKFLLSKGANPAGVKDMVEEELRILDGLKEKEIKESEIRSAADEAADEKPAPLTPEQIATKKEAYQAILSLLSPPPLEVVLAADSPLRAASPPPAPSKDPEKEAEADERPAASPQQIPSS